MYVIPISLKYSYVHLFCCSLWLPLPHNGIQSSDRLHSPQKQNKFYHLTLPSKGQRSADFKLEEQWVGHARRISLRVVTLRFAADCPAFPTHLHLVHERTHMMWTEGYGTEILSSKRLILMILKFPLASFVSHTKNRGFSWL